jgi:predicted nucleic acid-binding Zn ribbon protein
MERTGPKNEGEKLLDSLAKNLFRMPWVGIDRRRSQQVFAGVTGREAMKRDWVRIEEAWAAAVGPDVATQAKPTSLRAGLLRVLVGNSCLVQELTYRKRELVEQLRRRLPDLGVEALRFRAAGGPWRQQA